LRWLVGQAFLAPLDRLVGLPEWIDTERYAIVGTIPDGVPVSALPALMTNLLKDRFRMVSHTETREMPIYNLVLARSDKRLGPSLKETSAECRAAMEARLAAPQRGASPPSAPTVSGGRASTRDDDAIVIDWQTRTENLKEGGPFDPSTGCARSGHFSLQVACPERTVGLPEASGG